MLISFYFATPIVNSTITTAKFILIIIVNLICCCYLVDNYSRKGIGI